MSNHLWAHSPNKQGLAQCLSDHQKAVGELASEFAGRFGANELGRILGNVHDIGKTNPDFQDYLRKASSPGTTCASKARPVPHSIYGGLVLKKIGQDPLAIVASAHHGGLEDLPDSKHKLAETVDVAWFKKALDSLDMDSISKAAIPQYANDRLTCEFLIRMLFSALVDADWLDTEAHFEPQKRSIRGSYATFDELWDAFSQDQERLIGETSRNAPSRVNKARCEIYEACLKAAEGEQGVYRLTVPTGGGKTRSSMGFALRHALKHNLDRIIYAIPYTSIIDQTADVYKSIFGEENVIEHHSALEVPPNVDEAQTELELRRQLAAENWDARIIVTTTVQLFDSLFSNKPSRCRKLHNLARSVLVIDEVQTIPIDLVQPILDVLKELVAHYGVTLVLSTATQPAFSGNSPYLKGFQPEPCEIVPNHAKYFDVLRRVDYRVESQPWTWEHVADEMRGQQQALCVVNTRKDALALFELLNDNDATFHLSTLMCPAHRRDTLEEIRRRLRDGEPCLVVSTQMVEAGVDLDFPVVLRAIGPLDRIVQAAGRCNREGSLGIGQVIVFTPEEGSNPRGTYKTAMSEAQKILSTPDCNLHSPEVFDRYFTLLWQDCDLDPKRITEKRKAFLYASVAQEFRMIADDTAPVVVHYGSPDLDNLLAVIKYKGSANRDEWRRLQSLSVSIWRSLVSKYEQQGFVKPVIEGLYEWTGVYNRQTGISTTECPDPADLVV